MTVSMASEIEAVSQPKLQRKTKKIPLEDRNANILSRISGCLPVGSTHELIRGNLSMKKSQSNLRWHERFCRIVGDRLEIFCTKQESLTTTTAKKPVEEFNLKNCESEVLIGFLPYQFLLRKKILDADEDAKPMCILRAHGPDDVHDWIVAIRVASCARIVPLPYQMSESFTTTIVFVRHGQYINVEQKVPDNNKCLSPLGIEQAHKTGEYLQNTFRVRLPITMSVESPNIPIVHSTLTRARETASIINSHLASESIYETALLSEAYPCEAFPGTGENYTVEKRLDMELDSARVRGAFKFICAPDGIASVEPLISMKEILDQARDTFESIFKPSQSSKRWNDRYKVIVCHANVIRYFVCRALGVKPDGAWGKMRIDHCSITSIDVDYPSGNLMLSGVNQSGHLPHDMTTER